MKQKNTTKHMKTSYEIKTEGRKQESNDRETKGEAIQEAKPPLILWDRELG